MAACILPGMPSFDAKKATESSFDAGDLLAPAETSAESIK
jgi:hypothetical protein